MCAKNTWPSWSSTTTSLSVLAEQTGSKLAYSSLSLATTCQFRSVRSDRGHRSRFGQEVCSRLIKERKQRFSCKLTARCRISDSIVCATLIIRFHTQYSLSLTPHMLFFFLLLIFREQTTHISNIIKYCINSLGRFDDHRPSRCRLIHSLVCEKEWDGSVIQHHMPRVSERHVNVMTEGASHESAMHLVWTSVECPSTEVADWSQQLPSTSCAFFSCPSRCMIHPPIAKNSESFARKNASRCARCYFWYTKKSFLIASLRIIIMFIYKYYSYFPQHTKIEQMGKDFQVGKMAQASVSEKFERTYWGFFLISWPFGARCWKSQGCWRSGSTVRLGMTGKCTITALHHTKQYTNLRHNPRHFKSLKFIVRPRNLKLYFLFSV